MKEIRQDTREAEALNQGSAERVHSLKVRSGQTRRRRQGFKDSPGGSSTSKELPEL